MTYCDEAAEVSDGGRPLPWIVPYSLGYSPSLYVYVHDALIVNEYVSFGFRIGETNWPLSARTWWFALSLFTQVTVSPSVIVVDDGENVEPKMLIVLVAAPAGPATARVITAASARISLRIVRSCLSDVRLPVVSPAAAGSMREAALFYSSRACPYGFHTSAPSSQAGPDRSGLRSSNRCAAET